jgi:DNA (cytosine-5)-methyltransferase 1
LKYLSVCSGIEAASVAWHPLGWQPVAFSEIEPFPSAVLAHHYPTVPNLGDMTKFQEWPDESIDLLVGGTPCQSFSVAGLRKGLEDPRGNLMLTYLAIAQRYRPRWVVWENVPGVLSSGGGRDFGTLLGALGELGYGWAYRVLDAQWFGVAQRRRRVFVVGHLGDWQRAAQVLFERESVRRDTPPSREAREGSPFSTPRGIEVSCYERHDQDGRVKEIDVFPTLHSKSDNTCDLPIVMERPWESLCPQCAGEGAWLNAECGLCGGIGSVQYETAPIHFRKSRRAQSVDDHETWVEDGVSNTLNCFDAGEDGTGRGTPLVPVVFKVRGGVEREDGSRGSTNIGKQAGKGYLGSEERAFTLAAAQDQFVAQPVAFHNRQDPDVSGDITHPLGAKDNGMAVAQPVAFDTYNQTVTGDTAQTLCSRGDTPGGNAHLVPAVAQPVAWDEELNARENLAGAMLRGGDGGRHDGVMTTAMQVRRLTPVECERLQGFPDGYTNIPWRKKPEAPDGPRYKALGNSMAVPCMAWIGQRIAEVDSGD